MEKDLEKDMQKDLYELLGVPDTATVKQVKKAFRKKALKCHPDKNPDNPQAASHFHELSRAMEILITESMRTQYDKLYKARKATEIRNKQIDSRRRKFKEELELRERNSLGSQNTDSKTSEREIEIKRLRKEGSRELLEEINRVRKALSETFNKQAYNYGNDCVLKVKWSADKKDTNNGGYSRENLHSIFSKYGDVAEIVLATKNGSAIVQFLSSDAATIACQLEKGFQNNPLSISKLDSNIQKNEPREKEAPKFPSFTRNEDNPSPPYPSVFSMPSHASMAPSPTDDFEEQVLARLREAQKSKSSSE